jgi:hypothetical protein
MALIEGQILAGVSDRPGLCLALTDWSMEARIIQHEERRRDAHRRREGNKAVKDQTLIE